MLDGWIHNECARTHAPADCPSPSSFHTDVVVVSVTQHNTRQTRQPLSFAPHARAAWCEQDRHSNPRSQIQQGEPAQSWHTTTRVRTHNHARARTHTRAHAHSRASTLPPFSSLNRPQRRPDAKQRLLQMCPWTTSRAGRTERRTWWSLLLWSLWLWLWDSRRDPTPSQLLCCSCRPDSCRQHPRPRSSHPRHH